MTLLINLLALLIAFGAVLALCAVLWVIGRWRSEP